MCTVVLNKDRWKEGNREGGIREGGMERRKAKQANSVVAHTSGKPRSWKTEAGGFL